jgi:uncharacterized surface protein with fasciclin (FAS1) repeats
LKRYILFDTLATTTTLATANLTSSAGENVNATILPNGTYSVNGLNIVGENTLIKNGVIHYIDGVSIPNHSDTFYLFIAISSHRIAEPTY